MFNFKRMFKFAAAAAVALGMVSCAGEDIRTASEGNMIPDNAVFAMQVNAGQLWDKALGAPGSEARQLWAMSKKSLPLVASSLGEIGTLVNDVVSDPAKIGLCMDKPMVLSFSADMNNFADEQAAGEACLVALLEDSEAFVKTVDSVLKLVRDETGVVISKEEVGSSYAYYSFSIDEEVAVDALVTDESVVIRLKGDTTGEIKNLKASMLELFANGGPAAAKGLDAFYGSKGEFAMWMNYEGIMNMAMPVLESEEPSSVAVFQQYMPMLKGASMVMDLEFKNGQTVLQCKVFGSEEMMKYSEKYYAEASSKYLAEIPFEPCVVVNGAMKDLAGLVKEMSAASPELAEGFEYLESKLGIDEKFIEGLPGLITFALDGRGIDYRELPGFLLLMECDANVWEFAEQYLEMYADEVEEDLYCIEDMFCISYAEGTLKVADIYTFISQPDEFSYEDSYLGQQIEKGGVVIDLSKLPSSVLDAAAREIDYSMTGSQLLEFVNSIVINYHDTTSIVTLNMGDSKENLLGKFVQTALEEVLDDYPLFDML